MTHTEAVAVCGNTVRSTAMAIQPKVQGSLPRSTDAAPVLMPVIVLLLSMGACATIPPDGPPMAAAQCDANGARWALGQEPGSDVVERARTESGSATVRVVHPGQAVTMDFGGDRLNLNVNERNAIDAIRCG